MGRKDFPHLKLIKDGKSQLIPATSDELDKFLGKMQDVDDWRTVTNEDEERVVLSKEELDIVYRLQQNEYADSSFNPYEPYVDFFTGTVSITPLSAAPEPKRRFVPSKWEEKKIMKIVRAIRKGLIVPSGVPKKQPPRFYNLWGDADSSATENKWHVAAPKEKLPDNSESYNPPEEYLLSDDEVERWTKTEPEDRARNFIPKKYSSLRLVPAYEKFIQERFSRCLDLYLCPRVRKNKLNIDPESLIPKLPDLKDLKPYPTATAKEYLGHTDTINCISIDPSGQWLLSSSEDKSVRLFEVASGRCHRTWQFEVPVRVVSWNPNDAYSLFAAAADNAIYIIDPTLCCKHSHNSSILPASPAEPDSKKASSCEWTAFDGESFLGGFRWKISLPRKVSSLSWHRRGDYFSNVCVSGQGPSLFVHQLSKKLSQVPLKKIDGILQIALFHPAKPQLVVSTQKSVKIYDLIKQELVKKLTPGVQNLSTTAVHPGGDHVLIGSHEGKVSWFDLDFSSKSYKDFSYHKQSVRSAVFHSKLPLFASCSDDGTLHIMHGTVYQDLMQNPLLIPLKVLRPHAGGIIQAEFHPKQPWIFTVGTDKKILLST